MEKIVITSGYYNPFHIGHLSLFKKAKLAGNFLVVIVNSDEQVKLKGSFSFMPEKERLEIIKSIRYVDDVFLSIDKDKTIRKSIEAVYNKYKKKATEFCFAKGGDSTSKNVPELEICKNLGIKILYGVGGGKIQSSSWLINKVKAK